MPTTSLVMAIGIAAFNRFTEDESSQSLTTMDAVLTTSENQSLTKGIVLAAKHVWIQLCDVTRNVFASFGVGYQKRLFQTCILESILIESMHCISYCVYPPLNTSQCSSFY